MRIDVHTHVWPERIAQSVAEYTTNTMNLEMSFANTVEGIKAHMRDSGYDKSIVLGIVDRADHVHGANDWLIGIQDESLVPFGAMHPGLGDKPAEIRRLRDHGIKGIKLHPLINRFYPDDPSMFPLYEEIGDSMVIEVHCGTLPHLRAGGLDYAAPQRIANVLQQFPHLKVIALHLGGYYMLDEAERVLIGKENVLIDTSWPPSVKEIAPRTLVEIVNRHGAEKVCFGTDFPFASQVTDHDYLSSLPLSDSQMEQIFGGNAKEFIGL